MDEPELTREQITLLRGQLDEREQELVATMSHRLVNKILHKPTVRLKKEAAAGNGAVYIEVTRQLFALDNKFA